MKKEVNIRWLKKVQTHDFAAAYSYLNLIFDDAQSAQYIKKLKTAPLSLFHVKDIFRASQLTLLGIANYHVDADRKKIKKHIKLSPILLVRDTLHGKVIIADGYHRMCAVYSFNEDATIPCVII